MKVRQIYQNNEVCTALRWQARRRGVEISRNSHNERAGIQILYYASAASREQLESKGRLEKLALRDPRAEPGYDIVRLVHFISGTAKKE